jgi:DNA repair exonuclease SbcCD ATPase subunit
LVEVEILASKQNRVNQLDEQDRERRFARDKEIADHTAKVNADAAAELLAEQKKLNDQRAKLDEEMVRAKEDAAQKAARAELDALQEAERKRERIAEQTVQSFLDELNAKRAAEKQWEQDQKKAERLRNVKGQQAQDFVKAVDAIKAARGQANPMQLQIAAAQKAVEEAGKQIRKLEDIERELKQNGVMMKNLLGLG